MTRLLTLVIGRWYHVEEIVYGTSCNPYRMGILLTRKSDDKVMYAIPHKPLDKTWQQQKRPNA